MYKLIAIDIDGTLLNSNGEVTENTKLALKKAMEQGMEIVLASRKNYRINRKYVFRGWHKKLFDFWKWCCCL